MKIEEFDNNIKSYYDINGTEIQVFGLIIDAPVEIGEGTKIWHYSHISKGAKIGKNCTIGEGVYIGPNVKIGANCKIQNHAQIFEGVEIGNECFIGPCVCFTNDKYPQEQKWWEKGWKFEALGTFVGNNVAIGANSTIICGITLNNGCSIGAGSIITKSVKSNQLVYGKY